MDDLYRRAEEVIIWLGDADDTSDAIIKTTSTYD
jgi:hypothetical protein